ncbi:hypothetical protein BH24GEM2_BH24GEM2_16800 [soil metagenome]
MIQLMSGAIVTGYLVTGLFFLRYWRQSGDRLFAIFAAAFWLLAVQRLALALTTQYFEDVTWLYGVRLVAFVLILLAIIDKNRARA